MFGYVILAGNGLDKAHQDRYRSFYCGLCHALKKQYGDLSRLTLSYDLTFLALLLSSLYEPVSESKTARCLPHPFHPHQYITSQVIDYCADMNLLLAYHKIKDDIQDEHSFGAAAEEKVLRKQYEKAASRYPEKCRHIETILTQIHEEESKHAPSVDRLANLTGEMLGVIYTYRNDYWKDALLRLGNGLGRFIYLMDAYDDLPKDLRKKSFNPLTEASQDEDYEDFIKQSLTLLIAEATEAFEELPLGDDVDILRNVLYAGIWSKYEQLHRQHNQNVPSQTETGE